MKSKLFIFMVIGMLICNSLFSLQIKTNYDALYKEGGVFEDDYIFAGNELIFIGSAMDLFFVGKKMIFEGSTYSGVYAIGETIEINGTIGNDLFSGAGNLEINGKITGTVFMASNNCLLSGDSIIDGNIFIASGTIKLNGTINGDIYIASGVIYIDGTVNGNVKAAAGDIVITEKGKVNGNLEYSTENKLNKNEEQRISGKITYEEYVAHKDLNKAEIFRFFSIVGIIFTILGFLSVLVSGLLLLLLPCLKNFDYAGSHKQFWYYLIWGLIPFFIYPMLVIVSMILVVTIPLGFIILLAGLPLLLVTQIIGITAFGQYLFRLFKWKKTNRFLYFLFGFIFYVLISIIPVINILSVIFFSCIGWGIILEKIFKKKFINNEVNTEQA